MVALRRLWDRGAAAASKSARPGFNRDITVVVFTASARRLGELDMATGPCVSTSGSSEALCSALSQDRGETPWQTAALYSVLTSCSADGALIEVGRSGAGALYRCADEFVEAMAEANELLIRLADQDEAAGDGEFSRFAAQWSAYDRAWLAAGDWPSEVVGMCNRLTRLGRAAIARENSQPLYCWFGPAVPEFVVRASG